MNFGNLYKLFKYDTLLLDVLRNNCRKIKSMLQLFDLSLFALRLEDGISCMKFL